MRIHYVAALLFLAAGGNAWAQSISISEPSSRPPSTLAANESYSPHNSSYLIAPGVSVTPLYQGAPTSISSYTPDNLPTSYQGPVGDMHQPRTGTQTISVGSSIIGVPSQQNHLPQLADDPNAHRFYMEQNGRKMSADDFEAWMKSRGLRIAGGKP